MTLAGHNPTARLREFLPCIASLSETAKIDGKREPISSELVARISGEELEKVA